MDRIELSDIISVMEKRSWPYRNYPHPHLMPQMEGMSADQRAEIAARLQPVFPTQNVNQTPVGHSSFAPALRQSSLASSSQTQSSNGRNGRRKQRSKPSTNSGFSSSIPSSHRDVSEEPPPSSTPADTSNTLERPGPSTGISVVPLKKLLKGSPESENNSEGPSERPGKSWYKSPEAPAPEDCHEIHKSNEGGELSRQHNESNSSQRHEDLRTWNNSENYVFTTGHRQPRPYPGPHPNPIGHGRQTHYPSNEYTGALPNFQTIQARRSTMLENTPQQVLSSLQTPLEHLRIPYNETYSPMSSSHLSRRPSIGPPLTRDYNGDSNYRPSRESQRSSTSGHNMSSNQSFISSSGGIATQSYLTPHLLGQQSVDASLMQRPRTASRHDVYAPTRPSHAPSHQSVYSFPIEESNPGLLENYVPVRSSNSTRHQSAGSSRSQPPQGIMYRPYAPQVITDQANRVSRFSATQETLNSSNYLPCATQLTTDHTQRIPASSAIQEILAAPNNRPFRTNEIADRTRKANLSLTDISTRNPNNTHCIQESTTHRTRRASVNSLPEIESNNLNKGFLPTSPRRTSLSSMETHSTEANSRTSSRYAPKPSTNLTAIPVSSSMELQSRSSNNRRAPEQTTDLPRGASFCFPTEINSRSSSKRYAPESLMDLSKEANNRRSQGPIQDLPREASIYSPSVVNSSSLNDRRVPEPTTGLRRGPSIGPPTEVHPRNSKNTPYPFEPRTDLSRGPSIHSPIEENSRSSNNRPPPEPAKDLFRGISMYSSMEGHSRNSNNGHASESTTDPTRRPSIYSSTEVQSRNSNNRRPPEPTTDHSRGSSIRSAKEVDSRSLKNSPYALEVPTDLSSGASRLSSTDLNSRSSKNSSTPEPITCFSKRASILSPKEVSSCTTKKNHYASEPSADLSSGTFNRPSTIANSRSSNNRPTLEPAKDILRGVSIYSLTGGHSRNLSNGHASELATDLTGRPSIHVSTDVQSRKSNNRCPPKPTTDLSRGSSIRSAKEVDSRSLKNNPYASEAPTDLSSGASRRSSTDLNSRSSKNSSTSEPITYFSKGASIFSSTEMHSRNPNSRPYASEPATDLSKGASIRSSMEVNLSSNNKPAPEPATDLSRGASIPSSVKIHSRNLKSLPYASEPPTNLSRKASMRSLADVPSPSSSERSEPGTPTNLKKTASSPDNLGLNYRPYASNVTPQQPRQASLLPFSTLDHLNSSQDRLYTPEGTAEQSRSASSCASSNFEDSISRLQTPEITIEQTRRGSVYPPITENYSRSVKAYEPAVLAQQTRGVSSSSFLTNAAQEIRRASISSSSSDEPPDIPNLRDSTTNRLEQQGSGPSLLSSPSEHPHPPNCRGHIHYSTSEAHPPNLSSHPRLQQSPTDGLQVPEIEMIKTPDLDMMSDIDVEELIAALYNTPIPDTGNIFGNRAENEDNSPQNPFLHIPTNINRTMPPDSQYIPPVRATSNSYNRTALGVDPHLIPPPQISSTAVPLNTTAQRVDPHFISPMQISTSIDSLSRTAHRVDPQLTAQPQILSRSNIMDRHLERPPAPVNLREARIPTTENMLAPYHRTLPQIPTSTNFLTIPATHHTAAAVPIPSISNTINDSVLGQVPHQIPLFPSPFVHNFMNRPLNATQIPFFPLAVNGFSQGPSHTQLLRPPSLPNPLHGIRPGLETGAMGLHPGPLFPHTSAMGMNMFYPGGLMGAVNGNASYRTPFPALGWTSPIKPAFGSSILSQTANLELGRGFMCSLCGKILRTEKGRKLHVVRKHRIRTTDEDAGLPDEQQAGSSHSPSVESSDLANEVSSDVPCDETLDLETDNVSDLANYDLRTAILIMKSRGMLKGLRFLEINEFGEIRASNGLQKIVFTEKIRLDTFFSDPCSVKVVCGQILQKKVLCLFCSNSDEGTRCYLQTNIPLEDADYTVVTFRTCLECYKIFVHVSFEKRRAKPFGWIGSQAVWNCECMAICGWSLEEVIALFESLITGRGIFPRTLAASNPVRIIELPMDHNTEDDRNDLQSPALLVSSEESCLQQNVETLENNSETEESLISSEESCLQQNAETLENNSETEESSSSSEDQLSLWEESGPPGIIIPRRKGSAKENYLLPLIDRKDAHVKCRLVLDKYLETNETPDPPNEEVSSADKDDTCACLPTETLTPRPVGSPSSSELLELCNGEVSETVTNSVKARTSTSSNSHEDCDLNNRNLESINGFVKDISTTETVPLHTKGTVQVPHTINTVSTSEVSENVSKTSVVPTALGMDTPNKSTLSESSTQSQCSLNVSNTLAKPLCSDLDLSLPSVSDIVPDLIDSADDRTHSENLSVSFTPDNSFFKPSAVPSQEIHCQVASPSSGLSYSTSKDIATPIRSDTTDLSESISTSDLVLPDFKLPESYDASHSVTSLTTNISTSVDTSESTFSSSNPINKEHNATKHVSDFVGNKSESSQCGTTTSLVDKTEIALKSPKELNHECSKHISKEDNSTICARNEPFSELNNSNKPSTSNQKNIIFGGNVAKFPKEKNVAGTSNKESLTGSIEKLVINRDITSKDSNKNLQKSVSINSTSNACNNKLKRNTKFSKSRINEITNRLHEAHKSLNMLDAKTEKFSSVRQVLDNTLTDKNKTNNLPIISKDSPVKAMNQLDKRALHLARENESTHTINAAENGKNTDSYLPVDDKEQSSVSFSSTNKENHVGLPPVDDVAKRKERGPSPSCSIGESEKKRSSKNMNELDKEALFQPLKLVKTDIPISEEENVEPVTVFVILKNAGKVSESMIERITKRIANANGRLLQKPNKPSKLPLVIENMTYSNEDRKTKNASDDTSVNIVAGSKKSENSSLKNCNSKSNSLKSHVCSNKLLHGAIVSDAVVEKCEVTPPGLNGICKNSSSQNIPIGDQAIPSTSMTKEINEPKRTASSIQSELLLEEVGRTKTKTIKMLKHSTKRKTLLSQKKPQVTVVHKAILAKKSKIQNKVQENDKKMTISNEIEGVEEILKPQVQCNEVQLNCSAFDEVCELEGRPSVGLVIQANVNESTLPVNNYIQTNKRHSKKHNSSSKEQPNTSVEKTSKKINSDCIEEHSQRLRGDIEVKGIEIDILPDETNASKGLSTSTIVKQFAITSEEAAVNATQESKLDIRPAKPSGKFNSMKEKLTPADKGKPIEIAQNSVTSETKKTSGYVEKRKLKTKSNKLRTSSKNNDIPVSGKGISTVAKRKPLAKCTVALKRKSICDVSKNEMSFGDVNGRNNILVNEVKKHDEQSSFEEDTKLNQMQSIDLSSKESVSIIEEQHGGLKQIQLAGETPQSSQVEDQNLNKQSSIVDFGKFKEIKDTKNCSINETTISNKSILDHHDDLKEQFSSEIIVMQTENLNIQHSLREEVATEKQEEAVSELELFVEGSKTSELLHENSQKEFSSDQQKKSLTEQSPVQESNKSNQLKDEDLFKQCTVVEVEKGKTTEQEEPKDHCSFGESNESILVRNEGLEQVITVECAEITGQQKDDLQNKSFSDEADDTQHDFHERFSIENVVGINEEQNGNFQEDCSTSVVVETNEEKLKNPKEDFLAMETIGTNDEQNKNLHRVRSAVQADKNKSVNLQVQCSIDAASRTKDQNLESLGKELSVVDAIQTKDGKHDNLQEECTVEANETNKELQEDLAKQYAALEVIGVNKEQHEHLQQECINEESSLKTADQQEKFLKICSGEEPAKEGQLGNLPIECSSAETYKQQHEDVQKECSADKVIETKEQQLGYSQNEFYSEESIRTVEESHGNLQKEGSLVAVNEKNEEQCKDFPKQYFAVESVVEIKELQDHLQKGYFPVEVINDNDDHQQSQQNNFFSKKCMGTNEEQDFVRSAVQADENESANLQVQCSIDAASGTEAQNLESLGKELSVVDAIQTKDGKHDNLQKENSASKANETNEERQEYLIKEDAAVETNEGKIDKSKIESSPDEIINQKHENIQQECITANCTKDQELEISLNKCFTKEYIETIEPHSDKLHKKGLSIQQITSLDEKQQNLRKEYFNEELIVTNEEEQYEDSQKICPAEESIETNENKLNYLQIEYSTNEANEQQFGNAQKECSSKTDDIGAKVEQFDNLEKGCSSEESIETKEGHHENLQKECSSVNEILEESVQKERFPLDEFGTIEEKNENLIKECLTVETKEGQHENVPKECSTDHNSLQEEGSSAETIETNENQLELVQKECSTDKVMRATEQQLQNTKYECSREKSIGTIEEHHDSLQEEGSSAETIEEHHDSLQEEEGASAETNENQLEHVQKECSTDKIITETEQQLQNKKNECSREESIEAFEEHHDSLQEEGSSVETIETNENQLEQAQKERSTDKIITETEQKLQKTKNECSRVESIGTIEEHHDCLQEGSSAETIEANENQLEHAQKECSTDKIIRKTVQQLESTKNKCFTEESIGSNEEHHDSLQEKRSSAETIETKKSELEQVQKECSTDEIITETEQDLEKTKNERSREESIGTIEEHHGTLQEEASSVDTNDNQLEHVQKGCCTDKGNMTSEVQQEDLENKFLKELTINANEEKFKIAQKECFTADSLQIGEQQLENSLKDYCKETILINEEQQEDLLRECSREESLKMNDDHHDNLQKERTSKKVDETNEEQQLGNLEKDCSIELSIRNIEHGENFRVECSTIEAIEDKQNDLLKECSTADTIESKEQQHQNLQIKCSALETLEGNEELSATNEKQHESFQERCLSEQQKHENFKNIGAVEMKNEEIYKHSVKGCLTEETIETKEDQLKNMQKECPTVEAIEGNEGKVKNSQKECSSVGVIKKKVDQYENLEKGFHMVEINVEDKQENLKKECSTLAAPDEKQLGDLHKTFPSAVVTVVINEDQRLNLQKGIFTNMAVRTNEEQCENLQKEFSSVDIIHSTLEANETNQEQYKNLQEEGPSLGVICKDEEKHKNLIEKCSIFVAEEKHLNLPTECSTENTVETKEQQDTNLQKECFPEDLKKQCRSNDIEKPVHFQSEILEAIHVEHVPLNKQHFTDKAAETPVQHTRRYEPVCSPISSVECSEKESSPEGDNQKLYVNKIENNCIPVSFIETPTEESCQDVEDDNLDKYSPRSYKSKYFWKPKSRNPSKLIGAITENDSSNEKCPSNSTKDQDASEEPISTNSNTGDKLSTKGALNQNMSCITNPVPLRELETIKTIDYSQNLLQEYSNENSGKCKERHILGKDKPFKRTRSTSKDKQEPASKVHVASILNKENNSSSVIEKEPKGQLRVNSSLKENSAHLTRKNKVYYKELKPSCEQVREEVVCRSNIQKQDKQVSSFSSEDVKDASREKRNTRKNIKEDSRTTEKLRKVISSETCNLHPSNSTGDSKKTEDNFISSFKRSSAQKVKKQEHEGGKPEPPLRTSHDHLKCEVKINRIASKFYLRKLMKDFGVRIVYLPPPVYDSVIPSGESDDECNYKIIRYGVRNRRVDKKIKEEPILHKFDSKNEENILQYQKEERRKRLRRKQNSKSSNQKSSLNQTLDSPDINNSTPVSGAFSGRVPVPVDSGDISLTARHVLGSQGVRYNMPNHNSCSRDLKVAIPMSPTDLCVSPGIISSPDTISDRVPIHVKVGSNYNDSTVCSTRPSENVRYNIPINNRNCTSRNVTVPLNQTNCHDSSASIIPAPETVAERIPVPSSCESSSRNFKMPLPNTSHTVLTNCKTSVRDKLSLHEPLSKLLGQQYNCYSQNSSRKRPNEEEDIGACKRPNLSSSSCSRNMISPESLCSDQNVTGNANKPSTPSLALSRLLSCTKEELNELSSLIENIKKSGCDPLPSTSGLSSHCPSTSQNLPSFDYNLDLTVKKDPVSLEDIHKLLQKRSVARKKDEADFLGFEPIPHDSCSCKPDCFSECCSCSYFYRCQENLKRLNSVVEKYCTLGQGSLLENQSSHIFRSSSSTSVKNSSVISNKIHSTRALDAQLTNETFSNDVFHLESSDKKPSKKMKLTCFSTIPRRLETHLSQSNSNDSPLLVYPANDDEGLNTPGPSRPRQCKALTPGFYSVASPKSDEDDSDS